jgi:solute carrier family 35 protein F1/2
VPFRCILYAKSYDFLCFLELYAHSPEKPYFSAKALTSLVHRSILERDELKAIHWSTGAVFPFLRFTLTMFLFYPLVPVLLKTNGATMFNLSLLTSDMWAVLIRTFGYHEKVDWLYFLAFATTATGLIIYSMKEKDQEEHRFEEVGDEAAMQRKLLGEDDEPGT